MGNNIFWPLMKDCITQEDKNELVNFINTSNRYTNGPKVKEFEERWSEWLGVNYSLFVSSGSTANLLLLSVMITRYNLKKGDKVLYGKYSGTEIAVNGDDVLIMRESDILATL